MKTIQMAKLGAIVIPVITLLLAATPALAGTAPPIGNIPEPGMLPLLGLGAVVLVAIAIRNRRNKK